MMKIKTNYVIMSKSKLTYMALFLLVVIGKIILTVFPIEHPIVQMPLFRWLWIIVIPLVGFLALILASHAGFPDIWDSKTSNKKRILLPLLLGVLFASFEVIFSIYLKFPNFHTPFPHSIPTYFCFGTVYEILFHLIPVVLVTWLVSAVILKKRWSNQIFWIAAILISLYEPYTQIGGLVSMGIISGAWVIASFSIFIFLANLIPLTLFRKYGFLSMILFRYANYLVWHIIWPLIFYSA